MRFPKGYGRKLGMTSLSFNPNTTWSSHIITVAFLLCEGKKITMTNAMVYFLTQEQAFSEYGIPKMLASDNGPQFASNEFRTFANRYFFSHETFSLRYLQSNDMTERMVQPVKQCMMKSAAAGQGPYIVLLVYKATPFSEDLPSLTELLNGRQYRALMPNCSSI